jgi:lipopolysaccharide/colanic/teichoic acid biosynthesis glycosyltransferase
MRAPSDADAFIHHASLSFRLRLGVKRLIDVVASSLMILLLSPVFVVVSLTIILASGRPIFYRQTRIGLRGKPFVIVKFRTMTIGADSDLDSIRHHNSRSGPLFKMSNDPRVTGVGRVLRKLSIDELPQLFNVLAGSMSLVGPRPALPEEVEAFPAELRARESMPQGLTGLWQLEGRMDADFDKYSRLDLRYVQQWSLRLDLWILMKTPFVVIRQALSRSELSAGHLFPHEPDEVSAPSVEADVADFTDRASQLELAE